MSYPARRIAANAMHDRTTKVENHHAPSQYIQNWLDSVPKQNGEPPQQGDKRQACLQDGDRKARCNRISPNARSRSSQRLHHPERIDRNPQTDDAQERDGPLKAFLRASPIASRKYARRRRHKTRDDRYEYKAETCAEIKRSAKAKSKMRHSHRRDGATLNQDFKAPNVESERLTLKHGSMPGFLGKGKASEAIDRRGLPDLTFSEMTFLGKKRQLDDARFRGLQAMTAKSKDKGGARDISGYFSDHGDDVDKSRSSNHRGDASVGLGSYGDSNEPQQHVITDDAIWRNTFAHRQNRSNHRSEAGRNAPQATRTVQPRSSVSNLTTTRRHGGPMLGGTLPRQPHGFDQYYSLDDLKLLAGSTAKLRHVERAVVACEDEPPYHTEGDLRSELVQTRTSVLLDTRASLSLTGAKSCSELHETAFSSRRPRAQLANPDPVLMPPREPMHEITNVLKTIPHDGFLTEPVCSPVAARFTWETFRPAMDCYDPLESYQKSDPAGEVYQWLRDGLDEFDADLLHSTGQPELQVRGPGEQIMSETAIRQGGTALEPQADAGSSRSFWDVQDRGVAIPNRVVAGVAHTRRQLLRPSQQTERVSPNFSGYKRPRLLY